MVKSLGNFNIKKSSSTNEKNIQWSQKNPSDNEKPQKRKPNKIKKSLSTNIIYTEKIKLKTDKIFKIKENKNKKKSKTEESNKKYEKSSITNSNIEQGWKRKAR